MKSILLTAISAEDERTEIFYELDNDLLDLVHGGSTYCPSGEYLVSVECSPKCGKPQIDCA